MKADFLPKPVGVTSTFDAISFSKLVGGRGTFDGRRLSTIEPLSTPVEVPRVFLRTCAVLFLTERALAEIRVAMHGVYISLSLSHPTTLCRDSGLNKNSSMSLTSRAKRRLTFKKCKPARMHTKPIE